MQTPDGKIYLLGDDSDYEFDVGEAPYLQPLPQPQYVPAILQGREGSGHSRITLYQDRSSGRVQLQYTLSSLPVRHLEQLRRSVAGLPKRWRVHYGQGDCFVQDFFAEGPSRCLGNRQTMGFYIDRETINGRMVRISGRENMLAQAKLSEPLPLSIAGFRRKPPGDHLSLAGSAIKEIGAEVLGVAAMVITVPVWGPVAIEYYREGMQNKRKRCRRC